MNNLKGYDEFINEDFDFKTFKKKVNFKISFIKAKAIIYALKSILFWHKDFMIAIDMMDKYMDKIKQFLDFMIKYDNELERVSQNGSDDEIREFINKVKVDYETRFNSSFIEDLKIIIEKALSSKKAQNVKKPKEIKKLKGMQRILNVISDKADGHEEEDPYGEEEWGDDNTNTFKLFDILRDGRRMEPKDFLDHIKELVLNKNVSFLEKGKDHLMVKFRTRIVVKDVKMNNSFNGFDDEWIIYDGVIFIDRKGEEFIPSPHETINILD